jgi:hypothetical protein
MPLRKTGATVDEFFNHLVDLIANEEITQERLVPSVMGSGMPGGNCGRKRAGAR